MFAFFEMIVFAQHSTDLTCIFNFAKLSRCRSEVKFSVKYFNKQLLIDVWNTKTAYSSSRAIVALNNKILQQDV